MNSDSIPIREILFTNEFEDFYKQQRPKVLEKIDYGINIIRFFKVISNKLVKKLSNCELYEIRISVDNEYRIIMFTVDNRSFISARKVVLINGFIKKSTKDYVKEINKAERILNKFEI